MPSLVGRRGAFAVVAGIAALSAGGVYAVRAQPSERVVACVLAVAVAAAVVVLAFRRARGVGVPRAPWLLLAAAAISEVAGRVGWWVTTPEHGTAPWPTLTSGGHALAATLFIAALLRMPKPHTDRTERARTLLDGATIAVAVGLVTWNVAVWPGAVAAPPLSGQIAAVVHALADVALATTGLLVLSRARYPGGATLRTLLPLCGAALALGAGDSAAVGLALAHDYRPGHPVDLFVLGCLLLLVGVTGARDEHEHPSGMPKRERIAVLAAVGPIVMVALAVVAYQGAESALPPLMVLGVMGLAALLLLRLVLALLDNLTLSRTLETRVAERTLDLGTREQWFRSLVQNSSDVVTVLDGRGVIRYQSPAIERLFGYDAAALVGTQMSVLLRPGDARQLEHVLAEAARQARSTYVVEFPLWHRAGHWCETETVITSLVDDPDIRGLVLNTRDVSERKQLQDRLTHQAYHDALTGLANRVLYQQRLTTALENACVNRVAVLFCDLNGFKAVNDAQGHDVGDSLLRLVAERLQHCVRPTDMVARFGGDEFAVLVLDDNATGAAREVAGRIADAMGKPFSLDGREVRVGVSVGIAVIGPGANSAEVLLRNADLAMYRAKGDRRLDVVVFEPAMHDELLAEIEVQDDLAQALGKGQLVLYYQPTIDLETGLTVGVEALMRWYHPDRGIVPPDEFIAVAEENGYIEAMGEWALFEACRQGMRWQVYAVPGRIFGVGVNISGRQVTPALVDMVRRALDESGLPPAALLLEMTESVLMERTDEAVSVLRQLKHLGVRIAVDDFGTGYSSLSYLSRFPVDVLKIDKHFVEAVAGGSGRTELARTIVNLGHQLHLRTVAEGIETRAQWSAMRQMGCDFGQGFLFSRPLPPTGVVEILEDSLQAARRLYGTAAFDGDHDGVVVPLQRPTSLGRAAAGA